MPYRVNYHDVEIICDTLNELEALLSRMQNSSHKEPAQEKNALKPKEEKYREWWGYLRGQQVEFIKILRNSPNGVTDEKIRGSFNFANNRSIAGVTAGIAKNAKRASLLKEDVLKKDEGRDVSGKRTYHYSLPKQLYDFLVDMNDKQLYLQK